MEFSISFLLDHFPDLARGLASTLVVSWIGISVAFVLGTVCAWVKYKRVPVLTWIVYGYVEILRGTPILAQAYLIYFGLPSLGISFSSEVATCVALGLW